MYLAQSSWFADKESGQGTEICPGSFNQQIEVGVQPALGSAPREPPLLQAIARAQCGYNCLAEGEGIQT